MPQRTCIDCNQPVFLDTPVASSDLISEKLIVRHFSVSFFAKKIYNASDTSYQLVEEAFW